MEFMVETMTLAPSVNDETRIIWHPTLDSVDATQQREQYYNSLLLGI